MLTVIRFTFFNRFRSKSFRVMTLILAILMTAVINLPSIIEKLSANEPQKIGVFQGQSPAVAKLDDYLKKQEKPTILLVPLQDSGSKEANEKAAKEQIAAKKIKGYLDFTDDAAAGFPKVAYKSDGTLSMGLRSDLMNALQAVKTTMAVEGLGLTQAQAAKLQSPVNLESIQISVSGGSAGKTESQMTMAYVLVYILLFLLYMGVIGFGNMVATEITSEKSSRVMEVLIASVSPLKQMFGKIIGICLLGLIQIAIFAAVAAANLSMPHNSKALQNLHLSLSDLPIPLLFYFIIFYLGGFFIYATVFAAVGSLVSRTEEVGQAIMPVTFLIVAAFMIAMFGLNNPTAPFIVAMSYVPFFSPLIMFLRIGMSTPALWEIWLSIAVLLASIIALAWLAAKIYRTGVLMYGKRPSFKELRKAMKAFKV
jgi:ABC-2 type transport system permease protein